MYHRPYWAGTVTLHSITSPCSCLFSRHFSLSVVHLQHCFYSHLSLLVYTCRHHIMSLASSITRKYTLSWLRCVCQAKTRFWTDYERTKQGNCINTHVFKGTKQIQSSHTYNIPLISLVATYQITNMLATLGIECCETSVSMQKVNRCVYTVSIVTFFAARIMMLIILMWIVDLPSWLQCQIMYPWTSGTFIMD